MSTPTKPVDPTPRNGYVEVDHVRQDGILAIISKRIGNGPALFTAAIFKTYDRDGEECKTGFFDPVKQGETVKAVLAIVTEKVAALYAEEERFVSSGRRAPSSVGKDRQAKADRRATR